MSKGLHIECFEDLENELGREPTEKEIEDRMQDKHSEAYDKYKERKHV